MVVNWWLKVGTKYRFILLFVRMRGTISCSVFVAPVSSTQAELSVDLPSMISSLFPVSVNTDCRLCFVIRGQTHTYTDGLTGA